MNSLSYPNLGLTIRGFKWSSTLSPGRHGYPLFSFFPQNTQMLPWWCNWKSLHLKQVLLRWLFISLLSPFCLPVFFFSPEWKGRKISICPQYIIVQRLFLISLVRLHPPRYPTSWTWGLSCHFVIQEAKLVEVHLSSVKSWGIHHYIFTGWGWSCCKVLPSSHWSSAHVHSRGYGTCFHLHKALGKVLSTIDWPVHERPVPSHIDHFVFSWRQCYSEFSYSSGIPDLLEEERKR